MGGGRGLHQNTLQGSIWGSLSDRSWCERGQLLQLLAELRPMSVQNGERDRLSEVWENSTIEAFPWLGHTAWSFTLPAP